MSEHAEYYSDWKTREFRCSKCAWTGPGSAMSEEHYNDLFDLSCPRCDTRLVVISYPTDDEVLAAAKSGHPGAIAEAKHRREKRVAPSRTTPSKPQRSAARKTPVKKSTGGK